MESAFRIPKTEINKFPNKDHTYGETDSISMSNLINYLVKKFNITPPINFIDLGCGDGKLCRDLELLNGNLGLITGVELSKTRHNLCKKLYANSDTEIQWIHGDFINMDWNEYDIIYACNTCFSEHINEIILEKWSKINQTNPKFLITLKELPIDQINKINNKFKSNKNKQRYVIHMESHKMNVSWLKDKTNCFVYYTE